MAAGEASIVHLDDLIAGLHPETRQVLERIFHVTAATGRLNPPETMLPWIMKQFGSLGAVVEQRVIKVTNNVTGEGTLFNPVRALRPRRFEDRLKVEARLIDDALLDPLSHPYDDTPEDPFGRIESKHCLTASNIAKYDGLHGMIIFHRQDPIGFTREEVIDYLETGWEWAQVAHGFDPLARYFFFLWNCLQRAGASLGHGHCQVVLGRHRHYAKVESLRRAAARYRADYGSDYFADLYRVHEALGLGVEKDGTRVLASLAPVKEREVIILSSGFDDSLTERVFEALACFRDVMHVTSFNLGLAAPPLEPTGEDWAGFPFVVRLVDRGYPWDPSSDIGTMELYAASVVSSDPFEVAGALRNRIGGRLT